MTKPKMWVCDICGFQCTSRRGLYQHKSSNHGIIMIKPNSKPEKTTYAGYNKEEILEFEKISFRNMVEFYEEELIKICKGGKVVGMLTKRELLKLRRNGIIKRVYRGYRKGSEAFFMLTDKAKMILGIE